MMCSAPLPSQRGQPNYAPNYAQPGRGLDCLSLSTRLALRLPGAPTTLGWTFHPSRRRAAGVCGGGGCQEPAQHQAVSIASECCRLIRSPRPGAHKEAGKRSSSVFWLARTGDSSKLLEGFTCVNSIQA